MGKFTQEQLDQAWNAFCDGGRGITGLIAAAPFLQLPWEEPNEKEISLAYSAYMRDGIGTMKLALDEFVARRNSALLPKPVDPRRAKILDVLQDMPEGGGRGLDEVLTDRILAIMNEVKT